MLVMPMGVFAEEGELLPNAHSGVLMDFATGEILFEKNKDDQVPVASMTKMVAQILILEEIEQGRLNWDDKVTASSNASNMGGSQIYLSTGEVMSVRDMFKGISMASANDATVAMAEHIAGSESAFVEKMNAKVQSLGLQNTHFKNCTGLDEDDHYSSAYDMAIIARELLKHDQILEFSSVYEDYLRTDTPNKFWLVNTNKLVRFYEGADGLKTGHTDNAKYCLAATAKQNNMRLIGIVLGEDESKVRNKEAMELLDYGFNNYQMNIIKNQKDIIDEIKIDKATKDKIVVVPTTDVGILSKKGTNVNDYQTNVKLNDINLPVRVGDIIGKLEIIQNGSVVKEIDLTVQENVLKQGFGTILLNHLKQLLSGNFI